MQLEKKWRKNTLEILYSVVTLIFSILCIGFILYHIWTHPNLYAIDFGWQIASSELFINNGLHWWSLQRFQWIINNLFYPPLQDTIVATIHFISWFDTLFSFLIYISILLSLYFLSTWFISLRFKYIWSKILYFLAAFIFFTFNKFPNISYLQWLWVVDILFTWLISQILWGLFLQLTIYEILSKKRIFYLTLYSILWLLSHLVVWPVIILLVIIWILLHNRKFLWKYILTVIWITAFFWLPFAWYKWSMWSTNIFNHIPHIIILILISGLFFSHKNKSLLSLCITWIIILLPTEIYYLSEFLHIDIKFPSFHYYRFASSASLIGLATLWILSDNILWFVYSKNQRKNRVIQNSLYFIVFSAILIATYNKRGWFWQPMNQVLWKPNIPTQEDIKHLSWLDINKRIFTIDIERPIDFSIDSLDQYIWHQNLYVKWLFRESSYTNQLISSYISNILSPNNSVLYHYYLWGISYETYAHIRNKFVDNYWIWYILVAPIDKITYLPPSRRWYLLRILWWWTSQFTTSIIWPVRINHNTYTLYKINPRLNSSLTNTIVSIVSHSQEEITINHSEEVFTKPIIESYRIENISKNFAPDIIYDTNNLNIPFTYNSGSVQIEKIAWNNYKITTDSIWETWLKIKINPLPWINFYDEEHNILPSISLPYARYIQIKDWNTLYMSYNRTYIMYISYIISVIALLYILFYYLFPKNNK